MVRSLGVDQIWFDEVIGRHGALNHVLPGLAVIDVTWCALARLFFLGEATWVDAVLICTRYACDWVYLLRRKPIIIHGTFDKLGVLLHLQTFVIA